MKKISYNEYLEDVMNILPSGAFLTVKDQDKKNTMTIGWGSIGFYWGRPIFTVAVRKSRYTYNLLENSNEFTLSFPVKGEMVEALKFCGSKSGRDYDKFKECNLEAIGGQKVDVPVIGQCKYFYECRVYYKQDMNPEQVDSGMKKWYPGEDYHTLYYGEILSSYLKE